MNYVYLKKSNKIPAVGVRQKLLNRTGENLAVDGIFGDKSKKRSRIFNAKGN
jgi:hypothetical protein